MFTILATPRTRMPHVPTAPASLLIKWQGTFKTEIVQNFKSMSGTGSGGPTTTARWRPTSKRELGMLPWSGSMGPLIDRLIKTLTTNRSVAGTNLTFFFLSPLYLFYFLHRISGYVVCPAKLQKMFRISRKNVMNRRGNY